MSLPTDPGLQPERTSMSWGRTSLAYLVAAAVMLRWAPHYGAVVVGVSGGLMLVAGVIYATQRRRYDRYRRVVAGSVAGAQTGSQDAAPGVSSGAVVALTAGTVVLGLAGMVFVLADARSAFGG
ncbi:DUF202 domain-containing protein [Corynebacterium sp. AOP40-9SA-29]|uniref:DUF202 domain-containing protein n=1 Tax=Corynebacterium sp. AOP40-9SA-29 TaxID=3457677 RepID=UPI0040334EC8